MLNYIVQAQGGASRRPGTRYVAEVKTSSAKVRLVAFQFSVSVAYVLEFGNQYIRFFKDGRVTYCHFRDVYPPDLQHFFPIT